MSSESDFNLTPEEIRLVAESVNSELLPEKSKERYVAQFNSFKQWCGTKLIKTYSESVLLSYFKELVDNNRKSLWAIYSMLKSCLKIYENLDISKYTKLIAYLKAKTKNYSPKKSKILEDEEIATFLTTACDNQFLLMKTALIIGVCGACRRNELHNLKIENVKKKDDIILIDLLETKTNVNKSFAVTKPDWVEIVTKYIQIRSNLSGSVGLNTIGQIPTKIATFLKLDCPAAYTGHCFHRTSATLLANRGGDLLVIKKHGGWKSSAVAEGYVDQSLKRKIEVAKIISDESPSTSKRFASTVEEVRGATSGLADMNTEFRGPNSDLTSLNLQPEIIADDNANKNVDNISPVNIDVNIENSRMESNQVIPGLFSRVDRFFKLLTWELKPTCLFM